MAEQQGVGYAVNRCDIPHAAPDVNQRLPVAAAHVRMGKKMAVNRKRRHHFSQHVVAGLRVQRIAHRPPPAEISQRPVFILLARHQKAAVMDPFTPRRGVVKTADHLHVRQQRHQRVAAGLAEDHIGFLPVRQQVRL